MILNLKQKRVIPRDSKKRQKVLDFLKQKKYASTKEIAIGVDCSQDWASQICKKFYDNNEIKKFTYTHNEKQCFAFYFAESKEEEFKIIQILEERYGNRDLLLAKKQEVLLKNMKNKILKKIDSDVCLFNKITSTMTLYKRRVAQDALNSLVENRIIKKEPFKNTYLLTRIDKKGFAQKIKDSIKEKKQIGMYDYLTHKANFDYEQKNRTNDLR